jgi:hypothetical protein
MFLTKAKFAELLKVWSTVIKSNDRMSFKLIVNHFNLQVRAPHSMEYVQILTINVQSMVKMFV